MDHSDFDLKITDFAAGKLRDALAAEDKSDHAIRVTCRRFGKTRFEYALDFASPDQKAEGDLELELASGVKVWIDPDSARHLAKASIDFMEGDDGTGFKFDNPLEDEGWSDPVADKFQKLLDDEINPGVATHGGYIELLDFQSGTAYVRMGGGCQGCGMASVTLRQGIEQRVRESIPEISDIIDTTDHQAGSNPYYAPGK